jgi:hypothetical protein
LVPGCTSRSVTYESHVADVVIEWGRRLRTKFTPRGGADAAIHTDAVGDRVGDLALAHAVDPDVASRCMQQCAAGVEFTAGDEAAECARGREQGGVPVHGCAAATALASRSSMACRYVVRGGRVLGCSPGSGCGVVGVRAW